MNILFWKKKKEETKQETKEVVEKKSYAREYFDANGIIPIVSNSESKYISEGYNDNTDVYAIVNKASRKFAQIPWYVYRVKKGKTKELKDYIHFSRNNRNPDRWNDIIGMRRKAIDESIVENDLSNLLIKPNRNQGQDAFFEQLYGFKLLTGEGNIWKNRGGSKKGAPLELFLIPRNQLEIVGIPNDPFGIAGWKILFGGRTVPTPSEDLIMWKFSNYCDIDIDSKNHLRGQAPLMSMYNELMASNEGAKARVKMNRSQGARGMLTDETPGSGLTPLQISDAVRAVNSKINTNDVAGAIAVLQGIWKYTALGMDMGQLKMIEQLELNTKKLCAGFNVPYEYFQSDTTFANKEMAGKDFLYNHLAPAAYGCRDELNRGLLPDFNLDSSQYIIEPDIMALSEAMEDTKKMIEMYKQAFWYTPNEIRQKCGEDPLADENMDKIYLPTSLQTLDSANSLSQPIDMNLLNDNNAI